MNILKRLLPRKRMVLKFNEQYNSLTNQTKAAEKITENGEDFFVVPSVMVKEMVLHGVIGYEDGPEYLSANEIEQSVKLWNDIPITMRHPEAGSAREKTTLDKIQVGRVYNPTFDPEKNALKGDQWLSITQLKKMGNVGEEIIKDLEAGQMIELSTSYYSDKIMSPGSFDGNRYSAKQSNIRPDHLAILPDQRGACSIDDGCGVNQNAFDKFKDYVTNLMKGKKPMNEKDKKALIAKLVANKAITVPEEKLNEMCDESLLNFQKLIEPEESEAEKLAAAQKVEKVEVINKLVDGKITKLPKEQLEMLELPVLNQLMEAGKKVDDDDPSKLSKGAILKALDISEETFNAVVAKTNQSVSNDEASKTAVIKELMEAKTLDLSEDQLKDLPLPVLNEFRVISSPMNFEIRTQRRENQSVPKMPAVLLAKPEEEIKKGDDK